MAYVGCCSHAAGQPADPFTSRHMTIYVLDVGMIHRSLSRRHGVCVQSRNHGDLDRQTAAAAAASRR